jgi:hypothetical protein
VNATTNPTAARRPSAREAHKILEECRELTIRRMQQAFSAMLDKVGDVLLDRANRTDVRDAQVMFGDASVVVRTQRQALIAEFERRMRRRVDERLAGGDERKKADFSRVALAELTLVETETMDESVITGNLKRAMENACGEPLAALNRAVGHLLDRPELELQDNPFAPATIVDAFADAVRELKAESRIKLQVLKEMNLVALADLGKIYEDLIRRLAELNVVPAGVRVAAMGGGDRPRHEARRPEAPASGAEVDVRALFQRMFAGGAVPRTGPHAAAGPHAASPVPPAYGAAEPEGDFPQIQLPGGGVAGTRMFPTMAPTPSGYVPAAPIISTVDLHEGLTRLQAGQSGFEVGGAMVPFSGIPAGLHNVLRDLQESPLGQKANQLESMTIEMVAMLFDFVFDTRDLPDGIKALLARLQIPVLKAAMLDGAFFAKKSHPARLLVNELAQAGLGWSPVMGQDDPLYKKVEAIVHRVLEGFADDLGLFEELRGDLQAFLAEEEKAAEANIAVTAEEISQRDRHEIAAAVARSEVERRIESYPVPAFLAQFLRRHWQVALTNVYVASGEDSEAWNGAVTTLEDLVWSVQPKRTQEDRRHLVALLPSLLKRMSAGVPPGSWQGEEREKFMANLVEAHAAAVKPSLAHVESPTAAVAEQARAQVEVAKASGDDVAATKAAALAEAMAPAPPPEPEREILEDEYLEIARSLERGMWAEFESDDGQLSFAKLAWVSPLRGTYLFTNRQGQKALSITAEELAELFRDDRARLVEAEPLIDRAMTSVMATMESRLAPAVA